MITVSSSAKMGSIAVAEVLGKPTTQVNLYLRLSDLRYVLVAKAGSVTAGLVRYQERNISDFYIRDSDFAALFEASLSVTNALLKADAPVNPTILSMLEPGLMALYSEFSECGLDEETLGHSRMVAEATVRFCSSDVEMQNIVHGILNMKNGAEQHSLMVSSFATLIALSLGWKSPLVLQKLALGGFLHDLGLIKIPAEISCKSVSEMSKDELTIFRSHVELSASPLNSVKNLPGDVSLMILEHHELADGSGYPRGLKDLYISPLGRVLSAANALAELTLQEVQLQQTNNIEKALASAFRTMVKKQPNLYNREVIKAVRRLFESDENKKVA